MSKKLLLLLPLMAAFLVGFACAKVPENSVPWRDILLRDVATDKSFRISDFKGKVVVLETMGVWCPTCVRQQIEAAKLHDSLGDEVVFITLDVDPNEDEARVQGHLDRYGFDWLFAISPIDLSRQLEAEFGTTILNVTSTPIVILDREQEAHLLRYGLKSAEEIGREIAKYR